MTKKLTTEEFIVKAKAVHGDKYDYSKAVYTGNKHKLTIVCPTHGAFQQTPTNHIFSRNKCPICKFELIANNRRLSIDQFVQKAKNIHGNKYDYSKAVYKNSNTKITIICPRHGEFQQSPTSHIHIKTGCPKCGNEKIGERLRFSTEEFVTKSKSIHDSRYDYSRVNYINDATKIIIICSIHGEFLQTPNKHFGGDGCPKCAGVYSPTTQEFVQKAKNIHGNKYDYSKVVYKNSHSKITIICPEHGEFQQIADTHLSGSGCSKCSYRISKAEMAVEHVLKERNYVYRTQVYMDECRGKQYLLPFDFEVILKNNLKVLIEVDGDQHRRPIYNQGSMVKTQKTDAIKTAYCVANSIPLIRLEYTIHMPDNTHRLLKDQIPYVIRQLEEALAKYEALPQVTDNEAV